MPGVWIESLSVYKMISVRKRNWPAIGLASCLLGLIMTPYVYVAVGIPLYFSMAFSLIMLPPLVISSGYLLWRFLSKPPLHGQTFVFLLMESASLAVIVTILYFVSRLGLFSRLERIGLFCMIFVSVSACCLPVVVMRSIALEQRISRLPRKIALAMLIVVVALSGTFAIVGLLTPPQFSLH